MRATIFCNDTGSRMYCQCDFADREIVKNVGGRWIKSIKAWEIPLRIDVVQALAESFAELSIEENALDVLRKIKAGEDTAKEIKLADVKKINPLEPIPIKAKPFAHQVAAYNLGITIPNAALLMEQGTGKTLTALAIMGRRYLNGEIKKVLVVAPAAVVPVWGKEIAQYCDIETTVIELVGAVKDRIKKLEETEIKGLAVAVINYESTWRMEKELIAWGADMIICDESQRIKTPTSAQSKCLHKLGKGAKHKLILSGTPVTQSPLDFYSQYKFLEPRLFGSSWTAFRARYAIMGGFQGHQIVGYQNLPELIERAHSVAYRVTKEEALDLPEQLDQMLYCELEPSAMRCYNELLKESITVLENEEVIFAQNVLSRLLRLSQLTGGFIGNAEQGVMRVSTAKLDLLKDTITDLLDNEEKKVVIFARFTAEIQEIKSMFELRGIEYGYIAGEVKQELRGEEVERFQKDKNCRVFVAQTRTAGLGITLTAADVAIFYSLDYSFADYDQARCRIHRIGQKNNCTYIHLLAKGTVDEKIMKVLASKRSVAEDVVDKWRDYLK